MLSTTLKTIAFTVFVPGTVAGVVPALVLGWTGLPRFADAPWLVVAGSVLLVAGVAGYLWCASNFVADGRGTPAPVDAPTVLVNGGLYRLSRNPMYVSVLLAIFGQAVTAASGWVAAYGAAVGVLFHAFVVLCEEPALRRRFGPDYETYCATVKRWGIV